MSMKYSEKKSGVVLKVLNKSKELMNLLFDEEHNVRKIENVVSFVAGLSIGTTLIMSRYYIKQYSKQYAEDTEALKEEETDNTAEHANGSIESISQDQCICPRCGAVLNEQEGFDPSNQSWVCRNCGQQCIGDNLISDVFGNVVWYCDECGTVLNEQEGFTEKEGTWMCRKCGYMNDVSEANIIDDHEFE